MTSHDCVAVLRRWLGIKKIGHGGTLDPMAEGVLPLAIGRATRLLPYLPTDKSYEAIVRFGITTTTDDLEGTPLTQVGASHLSWPSLEAVLPEFLGTIQQIPPQFSAIQVKGQRLYDLARRGQPVMPPPRSVTIHHLQVTQWQPGDYPELTLAVDCGPGTYIRSLARDLGQRVGTGATLVSLRRTRSGGFNWQQSLSLEMVKTELETGKLRLTPIAGALVNLPAIALAAPLARAWQQGQKVTAPLSLPLGQPHRVLAAESGELLGIGQNEDRQGEVILKAKMVLQPWIPLPDL
ncbi:MAG: tRNA pseudouridine(55) synthase TruB [Nodosilinea sp. LVE1205-7]